MLRRTCVATILAPVAPILSAVALVLLAVAHVFTTIATVLQLVAAATVVQGVAYVLTPISDVLATISHILTSIASIFTSVVHVLHPVGHLSAGGASALLRLCRRYTREDHHRNGSANYPARHIPSSRFGRARCAPLHVRRVSEAAVNAHGFGPLPVL